MEEDVQGRGGSLKSPIKLSGAVVKTIALVSMLIDHIAVMFLTDGTPAYEIFRGIGRMAFPIFCFMTAEGMVHTRNKYKYMLRMAVFALVSQPVYVYLFDGLNVMFTFLLGMFMIVLMEEAGKKAPEYALISSVLLGLSAGIFAEACGISYGAIGLITVYTDYFLLKKHKGGHRAAAFASPILCAFSIDQLPALFSVIPLALYSGEKGKQNKWFFYVFYPAHILLLVIVKLAVCHFHS